MYIDAHIAQQTMQTDHTHASHNLADEQPTRRLLRTFWSGLRQVAWGIDAFSSVWHGIDVPPDHGARNRPSEALGHPRP